MNNDATKSLLKQFNNPDLLFAYIDLFCGAGGTSTGVNNTKYGKVIACVNHDKTAIASHAANHPDAMHFIEDIRSLNLTGIHKLVERIRAEFPHIKIILWASLECTNFSKAKGGLPREADSRTLAEHLYRYIEILSPDYVQIENVVEFMSWGPLDERGKPLSRKRGRDWLAWCDHVDSFGYHNDWRELNAANYGAYTSRNRLFGIFAKTGLPIVWPTPSHSKRPEKSFDGSQLKKWMPVRDCLDFSDEGASIFGRKKPLVEKTLERIYAGLVKFIAKGDDRFISKYFSGKPHQKNISVDGPAGIVTTIDGQALVTVSSESLPEAFLTKYNSTSPASGKVSAGTSVDEPCHTVAVQQRIALVTPKLATYDNFMMKYYGTGANINSIDESCSTLTTKDRISVVFLDQQYGQSKPAGIEGPAGALTQNPKLATVFIENRAKNWLLTNAFERTGNDLNEPSPTILATGMTKYLMTTNFSGICSNLESPSPVITANRKHHYLVNPQYASKGADIENPSFTLIARMDKAPPYLVSTETGEPAIVLWENDSQAMQKIKIFMAHYGITDIKMRMLKIPELKLIQGFPADYVLTGTQTEQKKHIGNAVESHVVQAMVNAHAQAIQNNQVKAA